MLQDAPTPKQLKYIYIIQKAVQDAPKFNGHTKADASAWIDKYAPVYRQIQLEFVRMNENDFYYNWYNESING